MILGIPTIRGGLDDAVAPNFGRAPVFTIVYIDDTSKEIKDVKVVQNPNSNLARAAGIQTASFLASLGVNAVIAPSVGPNAFGVLSQAGVKVYIGSGLVKDVVNQFLSGNLQEFNPGMVSPGPGFGRGRGLGRRLGWRRGGW